MNRIGPRLRADDGGNNLQTSGSSLVAPNIRLAGLRYVSRLSGAEGFPYFLGDNARWSAVRSYRGSFKANQASRIARHRRCHSIALTQMQRKHFRQGANGLVYCGLKTAEYWSPQVAGRGL